MNKYSVAQTATFRSFHKCFSIHNMSSHHHHLHPPPPQPPHYIYHTTKSPHAFQVFLNNPGSVFEHKFFATLSVLMRNITEQIQDYTFQYYSLPSDQFGYNASVQVIRDGDETEGENDHHVDGLSSHWYRRQQWKSSGESVGRGLVTLLCLLTATYFLNRLLFRRNRLIQYTIELIVSYLILLPILPFVALFFGIIGVVRVGIWAYIKLFFRGKRFMVSPEDGFWAYEEHGSSSSSIGMYMIEGFCDVDKIKAKVRETVSSPVVGGRMNRRLITVFGFAVWEHVFVNPDDHVRVAKWGDGGRGRRRGGDGPWSDKDVLDYLSTFQDIPISSDRPGWEVIIVEDVRIGGGNTKHYACIFRMHHAMMDGISSANILHQVLGDKPFKFTIDPVEGSGKRRGKVITGLMYFLALVLLPRTGLVSGLMNLDNKYNRWFAPGPVLKGPKNFSWSRPMRMEALKKIKDESKTSMMTVLLSGLGGSYRKMEEGRKWKNGKNVVELPEFYHALAPVALLPYPDRHPRNGFSGVVLPVCVGEHKGALERLRVNHREFKDLDVGVMDILGNFLLIGMVGVMPNIFQKFFGCAVHAMMSLSNIPGSDEEICIFGGDKIKEMGAWLPCKFTLGKFFKFLRSFC